MIKRFSLGQIFGYGLTTLLKINLQVWLSQSAKEIKGNVSMRSCANHLEFETSGLSSNQPGNAALN